MLQSALAMLLATLTTASFASTKHSDRFFTLDLPGPHWHCGIEGPFQDTATQSTRVCRPSAKHKGEAPKMVLTAVRRVFNDSFGLYIARLRRPKPIIRPDGTPAFSNVRYVKHAAIQNHAWADAVHYEGEAPKTLTRYLMALTPNYRFTVTITVRAKPTESWDSASRRAVPKLENSVASIKIHESELKP